MCLSCALWSGFFVASFYIQVDEQFSTVEVKLYQFCCQGNEDGGSDANNDDQEENGDEEDDG